MDDQSLVRLTNEVDKTLHTLCGKYDVSALSLAGVILARLKIIAEAGQVTDEFNTLLNHVITTNMKPRKFKVQ